MIKSDKILQLSDDFYNLIKESKIRPRPTRRVRPQSIRGTFRPQQPVKPLTFDQILDLPISEQRKPAQDFNTQGSKPNISNAPDFALQQNIPDLVPQGFPDLVPQGFPDLVTPNQNQNSSKNKRAIKSNRKIPVSEPPATNQQSPKVDSNDPPSFAGRAGLRGGQFAKKLLDKTKNVASAISSRAPRLTSIVKKYKKPILISGAAVIAGSVILFNIFSDDEPITNDPEKKDIIKNSLSSFSRITASQVVSDIQSMNEIVKSIAMRDAEFNKILMVFNKQSEYIIQQINEISSMTLNVDSPDSVKLYLNTISLFDNNFQVFLRNCQKISNKIQNSELSRQFSSHINSGGVLLSTIQDIRTQINNLK